MRMSDVFEVTATGRRVASCIDLAYEIGFDRTYH